MNLKGLLWLLMLAALPPAVSQADQQVAVYGLQSLTNNNDLPHPAGVGGFLQKSLSPDIRLRFSASVAFDRERYVATIRRSSGPLFPVIHCAISGANPHPWKSLRSLSWPVPLTPVSSTFSSAAV